MEGPSLTGGGTKRTPSKSQLKVAEFLGEEQFGKELRDKFILNFFVPQSS